MSTITWKKLFSKRILDRGCEYYHTGLVLYIEIEDDTVRACERGILIAIDKAHK